LHQSHADEKRFREDAVTRLQKNKPRFRTTFIGYTMICFIEPDYFERKSREWRQRQKGLADQITEHQEAANDYVQDGIRLLELSKGRDEGNVGIPFIDAAMRRRVYNNASI